MLVTKLGCPESKEVLMSTKIVVFGYLLSMVSCMKPLMMKIGYRIELNLWCLVR